MDTFEQYKMRIILFSVLFAFVKVQTASNSNLTTQVTVRSEVQLILDEISIEADRSELQRFYQTVLAESGKANAENRESCSKMLCGGFICAMNRFKFSSEKAFNTFRLNKVRSPPYEEWPQNISGSPDRLLYWKWFLVANSSKYYCYDHKASKRLQKKLIHYYRAKKDIKGSIPRFSSITEFYKYFAAVMTLTYELGCHFANNLFCINQLWSDKEDFVDIFHRTMPRWSFTEMDMDMVNIAWEVSQTITKECQKLRVGYRLRKRFEKYDVDAIIPISDDCPKEYKFHL